MKFLKLSQMNGLDKRFTKIYFSVQFDSYFSAGATILVLAPLRGLSAAILGHIFNNLPSKENVKNPGKITIIRRKQMLLDTLRGGFGNAIDIWFVYRISNFFSFELLTKRHKNGEFQSKISPKVHHLRYPNYPPLKEQCLTCKTVQ